MNADTLFNILYIYIVSKNQSEHEDKKGKGNIIPGDIKS